MAGLHFDITGDNSNFMRRLQEVENGVRQTSRQVEQSGMGIEELFGRLTKAVAGFFTVQAAANFARQVASVRGEFQQLEVAFRTMLGSADKADALMQQLVRTAAITPFDLQGVASGAKQLLAYGLEADKVNETLVRLGDIAAGLSIPLGDMVYLYGTTMTQGRLFTQDLRQFMGRGIPLADELAKQFGVAKDRVGELVTAGKVGFPEVQKAIEAMTSEGGKFAGLMEAQSRTISGQISNLEDAIATMFNEIGKQSEGVISGAISGVSWLVENYEKVGKVIAELVAVYGTYKAVLITLTAIEKLRYQATLAHMAGLTNMQAVMTVLTEKTKALNKAMMSNPYVLAAAAVAGLSYGIYKLVTAKSAEERAIENVNKAIDEYNQKLDEQKDKALQLHSVIQDKASTLYTIQKTYEELIRLYPELLKLYDEEQIKLMSRLELKKELNSINDKREENNLQDQYNKALERVRRLSQEIEDAIDNNGGGVEIFGLRKAYKTASAELDEYRKKLDEFKNTQKAAEWNNAPAEVKIATLQGNIDELEAQNAEIDRLIEAARKKKEETPYAFTPYNESEGYYQALKQSNASKIASKQDEISSIRSGNTGIQSFSEQVKAARENVANLKKELDDLRDRHIVPEGATEGFDFSKAIKDKEKELADAQEKLNTLTGYDPKAAEKARQEEKEAKKKKETKEKLNDELLSLERQNQQDDINLKEEGLQKKLAQINLDYTKQEDAIRKRAEELAEANKEAGVTDVNKDGLTTDQQKAIDDANRLNADARKKAESEVYRSEAEAMRDYLKEYGTFQQQKLAIAEEYAEKIRNAQTKGEKLSLEKELQEKLSSISLSEFKVNFNWDAVFGNLSLYSAAKLKELRAQLKELLETDTSLSVTDKSSLIEQYNKLGDAIIRDKEALGGLFGFRSEQQEQIRLLQEEYDIRKKIYDNLVMEQAAVMSKHAGDKMSLENFLSSRGFDADTSNIDTAGIMSKLGGLDKEAFKSLYAAFSRSGSELANVTSQVDKAGVAMNNASAALKGAGSSAAATIAMIDTIVHGINDNVQSANELLQILEVADTKFGKGFDSFAKSSQYATDAWDSLKQGNIMGVAAGVAGSIKELGNAIGTWFGLGADWSEYNRMVEEYNKLSEIWDELIDKKQEYIDISYGDEARKAAQEVEDLLNRKMGANVELGLKRLNSGSSAGSHSIGVRQRKGMSDKGWEELRKAAADIGFDYDSVAGGRMEGLFDLTAKQLAQLKEQAQSFWIQLDGDVQEYLDTIIECGDAIEENKEKMKETLTGVSFDSFYDNFVSILSDMDKSSEDFADSFGDYLRNALLQNLLANKYKQRIQELYDAWAAKSDSNGDGIFDLTSGEAEELKKAQQALAEQIMAERDAMAESFGWKSDESEERTATAKGIAQASQDSVDELNGRFTTIQAHTFAISENMVKLAELQQMHLPLLQNLSYLAPIEENTYYCRRLDGMDTDLRAIKQTLENIELRGIPIKA